MSNQYPMMEWTDDRIRRFWDYESQFPENYFTYQVGKPLIDRLRKYFPAARTALDYGAGLGFLIPHLANLEIEATAAEFAPASLLLLNEKFAGQRFFRGAFTVNELLARRETFDLILAVEVIEHLSDEHLRGFTRQLGVLLADQGIAILTTPNSEDLSRSLVYCPESGLVFHRWQHVRSWSGSSVATFLRGNGFAVIDIFATNFGLPEQKRTLGSRLRNFARRIRAAPAPAAHLPHLVAVFRKA